MTVSGHVSGNDPIVTVSWQLSVTKVKTVVGALLGQTDVAPLDAWLSSVAVLVTNRRPDIAGALLEAIGVEARGPNLLKGLSIGEVGICYEALLAQLDPDSRRTSGQFFTPDDASGFMAGHSREFPEGVWIDPCCGVGNLAWHLATTQADPSAFVRERLVLMDLDPVAVRSAVALVAASFLAVGDKSGVRKLSSRAVAGDFLSGSVMLPHFDFAIVNPPYAKAPPLRGYESASSRDLFAFFIERIAKMSKGFIAVTPASFLSTPKFASLRDVLERHSPGGDVYVFDNVPDTLFRGFKFGSTNTSKTNFVRAAITVCHPGCQGWRTTPIIRWRKVSRAVMFKTCRELLSPRHIGPNGEWVKIAPHMQEAWRELQEMSRRLSDLITQDPTPFTLEVALTPRYYISATFVELKRSSKAVLNFRTAGDRDLAALVLNSSIPYVWWRALDGGISLPKRVLLSIPIPSEVDPDEADSLLERLRVSERENVAVKMNAGRASENVKHPADLVRELNDLVMPSGSLRHLGLIYAPDMFHGEAPLWEVGAEGCPPRV